MSDAKPEESSAPHVLVQALLRLAPRIRLGAWTEKQLLARLEASTDSESPSFRGSIPKATLMYIHKHVRVYIYVYVYVSMV